MKVSSPEDRFIRTVLLEPTRPDVIGLARELRARGRSFQSECLLRVESLMRGSARRVEGHRIGAAKVAIAMLPLSLRVIQKWFKTTSDSSWYELHFSLLCFLGDVQE